MTIEDVWTHCGFSQEQFEGFLRIEDAEDAARCDELMISMRLFYSEYSFVALNIFTATFSVVWLAFWAFQISASMQGMQSS